MDKVSNFDSITMGLALEPMQIESPVVLQTSLKRAREFSQDDIQRAEMYKMKKVKRSEAFFTTQKAVLGTCNVAYQIFNSENFQNTPGAKIGIMICGNNGLPGGKTGECLSDEKSLYVADDENFQSMMGQEESLQNNVLYTLFGKDREAQAKFYKDNLQGVWGVKDLKSTSFETFQGIDFVNTKNVNDFNRCYVMKEPVELSPTDENNLHKLDTTKKFPVNFIYADSVNVAESRSYNLSLEKQKQDPTLALDETGTQHRTRNIAAVNHYPIFYKFIKAKMASALDAMVDGDVTHALPGRLSFGINSGPHRNNIQKDFSQLLQEVLDEVVGPNGEKRGQYFDNVIDTEFVVYKKPESAKAETPAVFK